MDHPLGPLHLYSLSLNRSISMPSLILPQERPRCPWQERSLESRHRWVSLCFSALNIDRCTCISRNTSFDSPSPLFIGLRPNTPDFTIPSPTQIDSPNTRSSNDGQPEISRNLPFHDRNQAWVFHWIGELSMSNNYICSTMILPINILALDSRYEKTGWLPHPRSSFIHTFCLQINAISHHRMGSLPLARSTVLSSVPQDLSSVVVVSAESCWTMRIRKHSWKSVCSSY